MKRILLLILLMTLAHPSPCRAEIQTFEATRRVVMGSRESQEDVEQFARLKAEEDVLYKVGIYIKSHSTLIDEIKLKSSLEAITAAVVKCDVISKEWKTEAGAIVLYLTVRVTTDSANLEKRISDILKDRPQLEDYKRLNDEVAKLRSELGALRTKMAEAKPQQVAELRVEKARVSDLLTANEWFVRGMDSENLDDKILMYSNAIDQNPKWARPYTSRGIAYDNLKLYDKAIEDFTTTIMLDPKYPKAYFHRGDVYYDLKDTDRAISDYNKAIQLDPKLEAAYISRGSAFRAKGNYRAAISDYSTVVKLNPSNSEALLYRGVVYGRLCEYSKEIADYDEAIRLNPKSAQARCNRGASFNNMRDYDRAISDYNEAISLDSTYTLAYFNRGLAYKLKGDYHRAREDFTKSRDLGDPDAQTQLDALPK